MQEFEISAGTATLQQLQSLLFGKQQKEPKVYCLIILRFPQRINDHDLDIPIITERSLRSHEFDLLFLHY